jgi:hypothetical protein
MGAMLRRSDERTSRHLEFKPENCGSSSIGAHNHT